MKANLVMQIGDEKNHIPGNALPLCGDVMGSGGEEYWALPARGRGHGLGWKGTQQAPFGIQRRVTGMQWKGTWQVGSDGPNTGKIGANIIG